ncbi:hypothetical protein A4L30_10680 [Salmonella enterica subsp. enterica serovar Bovismorbificans]|nr:hypothetical protein [Salmonella enterica subsp. enterica serovar Bovismorbificans]
MLINQNRSDELELALSCTDYYQRPRQTEEYKRDRANGFTREDILIMAKEFYSTEGNQRDRERFFHERHTSLAEFRRAFRKLNIDAKRYFRIDGGRIYRMNWSPYGSRERKKFIPAPRKKSNAVFNKGYRDDRDLFVELASTYYSQFYNDPRGFKEILDKVDISRAWYKKKVKRYGIRVEFFMSLDNGELFPLQCRTLSY